MKKYVLDANALLILLDDRPGASRVARTLEQAKRQGLRVFLSAVNWGEVFYTLWRVRGEVEARRLIRRVEELPVTVVPVDRERATLAGELKMVHGLGYADSFAASLALELRATLITADPDFRKVGSRLKVEFLPRHEATSGS
ncbi:MAG TPA: type II toxin-antitoxin system VapC family toxin [Candidatus Acidoferrales bacterium]|nr:type II toxin-antitoxin system VapC family toxin [Candidatus Acidoferrales bacterium]